MLGVYTHGTYSSHCAVKPSWNYCWANRLSWGTNEDGGYTSEARGLPIISPVSLVHYNIHPGLLDFPQRYLACKRRSYCQAFRQCSGAWLHLAICILFSVTYLNCFLPNLIRLAGPSYTVIASSNPPQEWKVCLSRCYWRNSQRTSRQQHCSVDSVIPSSSVSWYKCNCLSINF
jgi:hypothetical protein